MVSAAAIDLQKRYIAERPKYRELAKLVCRSAKEAAQSTGLACNVTCRAKTVQSFTAKALIWEGEDPYNEINDKAGVRIVSEMPWTCHELEQLVKSTFHVLNVDNKRSVTPPDKFVYRATHFQVEHPKAPDCISGLQCEVQVLTKAESLWADTSHDLIYKPPIAITDDIKRTFHRLVSLVEIFDIEVSRAHKEMSSIEESPRTQLFSVLEPHHSRLVRTGYNQELSDLILSFFTERIFPGQMDNIGPKVEQFVQDNASKLDRLFARYRHDDHANPMIWQPEIFIILFQLESDRYILQDLWPEVLPIGLLASLGEEWGIPINLE